MRKTALSLLATVVLFSCDSEPKDYATVSGQIINPNEEMTLTIMNRNGFKKEIQLNEDGSFSDTLKVETGKYMFTDGNEYGDIYLANNNDISLTLDTEEFDESLTFKGDGADESNFFVKKTLLFEEHLPDDLFDNDADYFEASFDKLKQAYSELKEGFKIDDSLMSEEDSDFEKTYKVYKDYHNGKLAIREKLPAGSPSPEFEDYENNAGGTSSLDDFSGKYVYIDVWATWCGPCKAEIPFLKEVEEKYEGKNIEFVSISIDKVKDHEKWKQMILDKALGGTQLFADNDWKSEFILDYMINGIPRFILVDPDGNIVSADAPRPSSSKLTEMFDSLKI